MFDKNKFAQIIKNIKETYNSQEEFSQKSKIGRTYLSQYMNMKLNEPPKQKILKKLADSSNGITTYKELLNICGYSEKALETNVLYIYETLKEYHKYINNGKSDDDNFYEIEGFIEDFQQYLYELERNIVEKSEKTIFLIDILKTSSIIEDFKYVIGFILLYNELLKLLEIENYIDIIDYYFVNCFNIDDIYNNLYCFEKIELLSFNSKNIVLKYPNKDFLEYINYFSHCLSLAHLKEFDSNTLTELFKKKSQTKKFEAKNEFYLDNDVSNNSAFYMCPVYGQISAGQPNWAEECIEGRIPIDPNLMNIVNPEEHFFLRVNGESMNKVIKNGAYALIHKQDVVEDGEIAVVLVNGYNATLKKFSKQGDFIILEPMSDVTDDPDIKTQIYDKTTSIKILGKYIGKFEINK